MLSHCKARSVQIRVSLIAHALIFVQFQIIYAPIVRGQGGDHFVLLLPLALLCQQLLLQSQTVLQFLLLYTIFRCGGLLFQLESAVSFGLANDEAKHQQHGKDSQ